MFVIVNVGLQVEVFKAVHKKKKKCFFYVLLERMKMKPWERCILKKIWSGQYTHFKSFISDNHKWNYIRCLREWTRKIHPDKNLTNETTIIRKKNLKSNEYSDGLVKQKIGYKKKQKCISLRGGWTYCTTPGVGLQ